MSETERPSKDSKRTPEEEERIKRYIRLLVFVFFAVVIWYGFNLADF